MIFNNSYDFLTTYIAHFAPVGGTIIEPDVAVAPFDTFVLPPTPFPGPPPGDRALNPHARIVCEIGVEQSTARWIAKCLLWLQQPYVRYVFGIKLHKKRASKNLIGQYHRTMTVCLIIICFSIYKFFLKSFLNIRQEFGGNPDHHLFCHRELLCLEDRHSFMRLR